MKLSRIYSNSEDVFPAIRFQPGRNVILAQVRRPKNLALDSHCLGKTLLISLIDFLLLKTVTQNHFLREHRERFAGMEFYLEIELNTGEYVTVKRGVDANSKISIHLHYGESTSLVKLDAGYWCYDQVGRAKAEEALNNILGLTVLDPEKYRRAVGYFLRTQADYLDVFQLSKFSAGKHSHWKPLMGKLLGFDWALLKEKYDVDALIEKARADKEAIASNSRLDTSDYDKVKATLAIKEAELNDRRIDVERFNFYRHELGINATLVDDIEAEISELNETAYTLGCELQRIHDSLEAKVVFDLERVNALFEEVQVYFAESLRRSYNQLLEFNQRIYCERNARLRQRRDAILVEREVVLSRLAKRNTERERLLSVIQDRDSFRKFKTYSVELAQLEGDVVRLESMLDHLDDVAAKERDIKRLTLQRDELVERIKDEVNVGNADYFTIRRHFTDILHKILNQHALMFTTVNDEGNLSFTAKLMDGEFMPTATSEGDGTSYRKLMCAAFDLALLLTYHDRGFYRFVYHDGLLEGLDDRKKHAVLNVIADCCDRYGIQHILTVIQHDLPLDETGQPLTLAPDSVVRVLHDDGDGGRLFRMKKF